MKIFDRHVDLYVILVQKLHAILVRTGCLYTFDPAELCYAVIDMNDMVSGQKGVVAGDRRAFFTFFSLDNIARTVEQLAL